MLDHIGYERTMTYNVVACLVIFLFYLVFNCGITVYSKERKKNQIKEKMVLLIAKIKDSQKKDTPEEEEEIVHTQSKLNEINEIANKVNEIN